MGADGTVRLYRKSLIVLHELEEKFHKYFWNTSEVTIGGAEYLAVYWDTEHHPKIHYEYESSSDEEEDNGEWRYKPSFEEKIQFAEEIQWTPWT